VQRPDCALKGKEYVLPLFFWLGHRLDKESLSSHPEPPDGNQHVLRMAVREKKPGSLSLSNHQDSP